MIVGVTGTRHGVSEMTMHKLRIFLQTNRATELHHGDCIGFDAQAHDLANELGLTTVGHPPLDNKFRAFKATSFSHTPQPYFERNRRIVHSVQHLISAPDKPEAAPGVPCGGTWYTTRYARSIERSYTVITEF
jgi:hypothetical protein